MHSAVRWRPLVFIELSVLPHSETDHFSDRILVCLKHCSEMLISHSKCSSAHIIVLFLFFPTLLVL
uniref:Uncharacterized protein n=1 Tax=Anguilla anguilla TaxID=7936 RepID=A0A0E9P508_ANGAN